MEWKNKIDLPGEAWKRYHLTNLYYSNYGRAHRDGIILRNITINSQRLLEVNHGIKYPEPDYRFECWKPIPDFEGLYEVSDKGRIRVVDNENDRRRNGVIFNNDKPIANIRLYKDKKGRQLWVTDLVAKAFLSNPFMLEYSFYKDIFQLSNNSVENIFWTSMPIDPWKLVSRSPDIILYNTYDYLYEFDFEWPAKEYSGRLKFIYYEEAFKVYRFFETQGFILTCRTREIIHEDAKVNFNNR
jgi:hypothetical protein